MRKRDKFLNWLKAPHGIGLVFVYLATVGAGAGTISITCLGSLEFPLNIVAYALYGLAAVLLGYSVYSIVKIAPSAKRRVICGLKKYRFTRMLLEQFDFRTLFFATCSFAISVGYAAFNGVIGIAGSSLWYIAFAVYYLLLAVMRGAVLLYRYRRKKRGELGSDREKISEIKNYRSCGITLIFLPVCLSVAIAKMVTGENSFHHYGFTIFVAAIYAFYKIIMAVRNIFRARKGDDFSIRAARSVNLADAFVSILALQTAMLEREAVSTDIGLYNAITGGVVCALTVALGAYIIVSAQLNLNKIKRQKPREVQAEQ